MIHKNVLSLIGNTPIVKINKLIGENDATVLAKLEEYNIGGSIKSVMALYMIEDAEKSGKLTKDKVIIEASSGNTGIAMAIIAAVKGYKITIIIPESVSVERRKLIKVYGAELILSPGEKGTDGATEVKKRMLVENSGKYADLDQFKNPANIMAHYKITGKEILEQTRGKVDIVVMGIGTAGTGVGVSKCLKEYNSKIKVVGVMPEIGARIQGLRNSEELKQTDLFQNNAFDEIIEISKEEVPKTFSVARKLAQEEGILAGMSSGAVMYIAIQKARELKKGKTIVAILPD
ncbi:MAG: PLP-dependent cysteine synthase family protein, partial [Candidatus Andersenbacteria bacterium]|nr:PLP-dependent cysteine synthase family protein [Candidatus Andersenbacteria bacterium]